MQGSEVKLNTDIEESPITTQDLPSALSTSSTSPKGVLESTSVASLESESYRCAVYR